jgi:hypothetical protein
LTLAQDATDKTAPVSLPISVFPARCSPLFLVNRFETKSSVRRILLASLFSETAMTFKPTEVEQFAIQAKLNMKVGSEVFDSVFVGMQIVGVFRGGMQVLVRSDHCAHVIERNYLGILAVIAESVLRKPIRSVTVASRNVRDSTDQ